MSFIEIVLDSERRGHDDFVVGVAVVVVGLRLVVVVACFGAAGVGDDVEVAAAGAELVDFDVETGEFPALEVGGDGGGFEGAEVEFLRK